jgi:hypothetical protein
MFMLQLNVQRAADAAQDVVEEFRRKKAIMEAILTVVKGLLAFVFVNIIFG